MLSACQSVLYRQVSCRVVDENMSADDLDVGIERWLTGKRGRASCSNHPSPTPPPPAHACMHSAQILYVQLSDVVAITKIAHGDILSLTIWLKLAATAV